jgi:hypothetical protein
MITDSLRRRSASFPLDHHRRPADQRRIIEPEDVARLEISVAEPRLQQPLVKRHRPLDAADAAHAKQLGVLERLDVVDELNLAVHHPDVWVREIGDRAERPRHQPEENRRLLRDQQRRERQPHDDAEVFGLVADEHFERNEIHRRAPLLLFLRRFDVTAGGMPPNP